MNFQPLDVPIQGMQIWGCWVGKWSFVISQDERGWGASYRGVDAEPYEDHGILRHSTNIGHPWQYKSMQEAEAACRRKLKELRRKLN